MPLLFFFFFLHVDHVSSLALDWIGAYALVFKLSLLTFLFLLFLNEVVNAFFTVCNYEVVMFLRHFTTKNVFL